MSDLFESEDEEVVSTRSNRPIQQRNAIIALLIAIIAILVVIFLIKGCDDDSDNVVAPITASTEEQSSSDSQPEDNDTPADTEPTTEEEPEPTTEDEIEDPTPIPEDPESLILLAYYAWMDPATSEATIALQELLEIEGDGWYGMGTRAAHLAALEAKGLPTDNVPTCDLTVGEELCGVQQGTPMENALATLIAGMGEPDNESDWYEVCYSDHKSYSWGSVTVHFREEFDQNAYLFWSIINRFTESEGWQDPFPNEVKFAESVLVTWPEEDHRLTTFDPETGGIPAFAITDSVVASGEHLEPYLEDFETNIGYSLQYDMMWGMNLLFTDKYKVTYREYTPTEDPEPELIRIWRWTTDHLLACD